MISEYITVSDISEAVGALANTSNKATIIAGGTDSFLRLRESRQEKVIVDVSKIAELRRIGYHDGSIEIGAAVTLSELLQTSWLAKEIPSVFDAVLNVGSPQIRNIGTICGNILTGRAAAGVSVSTAAIGGYLKVAGPNGERKVKLEVDEYGYSYFKVGKNELVLALILPHQDLLKASAYCSFKPRKGFAYPSVSVSVSTNLVDGRFDHVSLIASPILPLKAKKDLKPCNNCGGSCRICRIKHLFLLERTLQGRPANIEQIEEVCNTFGWKDIPMRDSLTNGPKDYRQELLKVMSKRALESAINRANIAG